MRNCISVALQLNIESPDQISLNGVSSTLQPNNVRLVHLHNFVHDFGEEVVVLHISAPRPQGNVQAVVLPITLSNIIQGSGSWEKFCFGVVLMELHSEDSVLSEESFLHSVSVVHIDVYVQHSLLGPQQVLDSQNDIIAVTKPTGFQSFGMVETSHPVDYHIGLVFFDDLGSEERGTLNELVELEEVWERRHIGLHAYPEIRIFSFLLRKVKIFIHELDVVWRVEQHHF